jgi:hypothetical protein
MKWLTNMFYTTRYFWGAFSVTAGGLAAVHLIHTHAPRPLPLPCVFRKRQRIYHLCTCLEWDPFLHKPGVVIAPVDVQDTVDVLKGIPSLASYAPAVILYGPPLSGKTYCVKKCIEQLRKENRPVVDIGAWKPNAHSLLQIPEKHALKDYLPQGTLIIVDTADLVSHDKDTQDYLERLVCEAHESKGHFHVLFVMADPTKTKKWVDNLRGYRVQPVMQARQLRWGNDSIEAMVKQSPRLQHNPPAEKQAKRVGAPGFVEMLHLQRGHADSLEPTAASLKHKWKQFDEIDMIAGSTVADQLRGPDWHADGPKSEG